MKPKFGCFGPADHRLTETLMPMSDDTNKISRGTQRRPWTAAPRDLRFQTKRVRLFKV